MKKARRVIKENKAAARPSMEGAPKNLAVTSDTDDPHKIATKH